jgi:hypothetical protein
MGKDVLRCYTVTRGGAMTRENDVATWIYVVHLIRPGAVLSPTEDESAARSSMAEDPAACAGVMTADLHPFHVSLEYLPSR